VIERIAHWVAALRMWEMQPWLGVGPGNYAVVYASVALPRWDDPLGHAHNIYLNVLAETGIVGLLAFGFMWLALGGWVVRQALRPRDPFAHALAVGVAGVLAHLAAHSVFDNLFVQGMVVHLAFWLAVVAIANRSFRFKPYSLHESES
jgi:O-antigen ligase